MPADKLSSNEAVMKIAGFAEPPSAHELRVQTDIRNSLNGWWKQVDGFPGAVSDFGVEYQAYRFATPAGDGDGYRLGQAVQVALDALNVEGADVIVWRQRPECSYQDSKLHVYMRLHGLASGRKFAHKYSTPQGEECPIIPA